MALKLTEEQKNTVFKQGSLTEGDDSSFLMEMQRDLARKHGVVMDGRDIGTVVLPDADVKIFLTASAEIRAQRRYLELLQKGSTASCEDVLRDIEYRDLQDSTRSAAPLKPAEDAVFLDSSDLSFEQTVEAASDLIREKMDL